MNAASLQSPQRASTVGFTLLEVLVALTVLGLLFFGLVQGSQFVLLGWDRQTRLVARTEDLDAADRTLRRLIAQARPGSKWEPLVFAGTAHSATFTSIMPRPAAGLPTQRADVELVVDAPPSRTIIERTKALLPRAASCNASDANLCEKPTSSNTLPIVLAAVYVMYLCTYPVSTNPS